MNKKILIFVIVLIVFCSLSNATKTITVEETNFVNLKPKVKDADGDYVSFTFTKPLDKNGQWQTNYGDAGEYTVTLTASDGRATTSQEIKIIVEKKNVVPTIDSFSPQQTELTIDESDTVDFSIEASDLNKDTLTITWKLDEKIVSTHKTYRYESDYGHAGTHIIKAIVSDGDANIIKEWNVNVNKVDRKALLGAINDITIDETDTVKLKLPDLKKYNLDYSISEPIGNDKYWETTYQDSGVYDVTITIKDRDFKSSKTIKVTVNNADRPPELKAIANVKIKENQKVTINIESSDPDKDEIEILAENLPEGAILKGNTFEWQTNFDTVKKESIFDKIADKFHLLSKSFKITFIAKSNEAETRRKAVIKVRDINRAPVIEDIEPITVDEGEVLEIKAEAADPDGDPVSFSYSGWLDTDVYETGYDDGGTYVVKVTASDGFLKTSKDATIVVKEKNREPTLKDIKPVEIRENEKLEFSLFASDPDNGLLEISCDALPRNSSIEDNVFIWTPDYDTVQDTSSVFAVNFKASDGELEATKQANITVYNVNRAPKIISKKPAVDFITYVNTPTKLSIAANDLDDDKLDYAWRFSLLEKHQTTTPDMLRTFTTTGWKKVKVIVSDGKEEVKGEWKIKVVEKKEK